ncbi:uncharacterized protein SPAPADRAFT_58742 [Spathaspora passalidarum NRRL Y-27907]|uniref:tRNA (guanine(37)-N1)-methyltransferase n=1 Tax=Spathaspora passalidarum (strain NRRL Y-27907 / 11-Y1) TaxID=619300 RepID=G3AH73_SPAPN|nr:uncharacterized protein SPAPADRAFT_58742 [Spathaspora passalidarum NRRL Y-27907]EGW35503.1 hypothetical protein SPAPADRAFT_58742 [Spathaspora passalidarum NRRL Y-27907]
MNFQRLVHFGKKLRVLMISEVKKYPPPVNRSMVELDRSFFHREVPLLAAYFPNAKHIGEFVKRCKQDILYMPNIKHIVQMDDSKAVLLQDRITDVSQLSALSQEKVKEFGVELRPYTMQLDYSFWKTDDILRAILPENLLDETPSGFSQAGHLAHLNLKNEFKPYGKLIGQVILDKNPSIRTVVDKADTIANKFRTFQMNLLAGEDNFLVEQSESGCKFRFDFSKVYWNSRLSTEHDRLISKFAKGDVVGDVFAGVGPFAVPAGRKEVIVLANDLNPESYKYLQENITLNNAGLFTRAFNLDGREFIRQSPKLLYDLYTKTPVIQQKRIVRRKVPAEEPGQPAKSVKEEKIIEMKVPKFYKHYVMNLPDSALTFLDEFVGLYGRYPEIAQDLKQDPEFQLPMIHVHCFEKFEIDEEPPMEELHRRVYDKIVRLMGYELDFSKMEFHHVRQVAPTKPMFCVSFELPEELAFKVVS